MKVNVTINVQEKKEYHTLLTTTAEKENSEAPMADIDEVSELLLISQCVAFKK